MSKEIEWFKMDGSGVSPHVEDENLVLIGDVAPDMVQVPKESPVCSGERLRVLKQEHDYCPKCRARLVRILRLEKDLAVAECQPNGCGFVFYRLASPS